MSSKSDERDLTDLTTAVPPEARMDDFTRCCQTNLNRSQFALEW